MAPLESAKIMSIENGAPETTSLSTAAQADNLNTYASIADAERASIGEQIRKLEESIRDLKERRNKISLISKLPLELFTNIFKKVIELPPPPPRTALESVWHGWYKEWDPRLENATWKRYSTILHICQDWRRIAFGCPELWSRPIFARRDLDDPGQVATQVLAEMAARSKSTLLSIRISKWASRLFSSTGRQLPASVASQLFALERMRELHVCLATHALQGLFELVLAINANHLQSLLIMNESPFTLHTPDAVFNNALPSQILATPMPSLRCLDISSFAVQWDLLPLCIGPELVSLKLCYVGSPSRPQFYKLLSRVPMVERLHLTAALPPPSSALVDDIQLPMLSTCTILSSTLSQYMDFHAHTKYPLSTAKLHFLPVDTEPGEFEFELPLVNFLTACGVTEENPLRSHSTLLVGLNEIEDEDDAKLNPLIVIWDGDIRSSNDDDGLPTIPQHVEQIHNPQVIIDLTNMTCDDDDLRPHLLCQLQVNGLETIYIDGGGGEWDEQQWFDLFKRHTDVTSLHIRSNAAHEVFSALSLSSDIEFVEQANEWTGEFKPLLPRLDTMTLEGLTRRQGERGFRQIVDFLIQRDGCGAPLPKLNLIDCQFISAEKMLILKQVEGELNWDGKC